MRHPLTHLLMVLLATLSLLGSGLASALERPCAHAAAMDLPAMTHEHADAHAAHQAGADHAGHGPHAMHGADSQSPAALYACDCGCSCATDCLTGVASGLQAALSAGPTVGTALDPATAREPGQPHYTPDLLLRPPISA